DAQLGGREVGVQIGQHPFRDAGPSVPLFPQHGDPGGADLDDGKFGGDKKTVQKNQYQDQQQIEDGGDKGFQWRYLLQRASLRSKRSSAACPLRPKGDGARYEFPPFGDPIKIPGYRRKLRQRVAMPK